MRYINPQLTLTLTLLSKCNFANAFLERVLSLTMCRLCPVCGSSLAYMPRRPLEFGLICQRNATDTLG